MMRSALLLVLAFGVLSTGCATPLSNTREFDQRQNVTYLSAPDQGKEWQAMAAQAAAYVAKKLIEWEGAKYTATSVARGDITIDGIGAEDPPTMSRGGLLIYIRGVTPDRPMGWLSSAGNWFKTLDRPDVGDFPKLDEKGIDDLVAVLTGAECGPAKCFDPKKLETVNLRKALDDYRISVWEAVKRELTEDMEDELLGEKDPARYRNKEQELRAQLAKDLKKSGTPHLTMLAIARVVPDGQHFRVNLVGTSYVGLQAKNLPVGVPFTSWDETESKLQWTLIGPDGHRKYGGKRYSVTTLQKVEWDRDSARDRRSALGEVAKAKGVWDEAKQKGDPQETEAARKIYEATREQAWAWSANKRTSQLLAVPPFQGFRVETTLVEASDVTKTLNELAESASKKLEAAGKD